QRGRERIEDHRGARDAVVGDLDPRDARGRAAGGVADQRSGVEAVEDEERALSGDHVAVAGCDTVLARQQGACGGALDRPVERAAVVRVATAAVVRVLASTARAAAVAVGPVAVVAFLLALDDAIAALARAAGRAAVAARRVAVVALLARIDA